jgi:diadenosine tetraphosphate (Ap4A) HIT family hydrolase
MTAFELAPAFRQSSAPLAMLDLSEARLQRDARWPWIVLIPHRPAMREIEDLASADRRPVEKLNVGALGNITSQLHVHVVGRRADDAAWPGPVWGVGEAEAYNAVELDRLLAAARAALGLKSVS